MPTLTQQHRFQRSQRPQRGGGFTFLEVLFAVIIIGIGFIMIAAMFPVAIAQTQATVAESTAQNISRDAIRYLQANATNANFPVTYSGSLYQCNPISFINGNSIATGDGRFGWLGFYRRDNDPTTGLPSAYAQVVALVAKQQTNGRTVYSSPLSASNASYFQAAIVSGATGFTIRFAPSTTPANNPPGPITDNAYVVILSATAPAAVVGSTSPDPNIDLCGRVLRLGTNVHDDASNGYEWNLVPGEADSLIQSATSLEVFVLGAPLDPDTNTFSGLAQDVSVVTGIIHIDN